MIYLWLFSRKKALVVDAIYILLVLITPILAHLTYIPFYLLDPMRWAVISNYLILKNKTNALFLAVALPILAFIISGHPIFIKNLLISTELCVNVLILDWILRKNKNVFFSVLLSIVSSKIIYYVLKFFLIYFGLLSTVLLGTSILLQLVVTIAISLVFSYYYKN